MYESGGRMNLLGWMVSLLVFGSLAAGTIAELSKSTDITKTIGIIGSVLFWGFIIYRIFKRKR